MRALDTILAKLADLIQEGRFPKFETEEIEIKAVPATGAERKQLHGEIAHVAQPQTHFAWTEREN